MLLSHFCCTAWVLECQETIWHLQETAGTNTNHFYPFIHFNHHAEWIVGSVQLVSVLWQYSHRLSGILLITQGGSSVLQACYFTSRKKNLISYKSDINRPADKYPKRTEYARHSEIWTDVRLAKKKVIQAVFVWKFKNRSFCHLWQERPGWVMIDVTRKNTLSLENDIRIIRI